NVVEGSLRREGNRVRITAELINARSGFHLWTETYDRELKDVFALQDEITRSIVDALKIKLAVSLPVAEQRNTEVYDLYLQGLFFSNKSSEEDLRRALNFFQRVLEKDPTFARAWTGIAKVWYFLADVYVKPLEAYPASKEAALKAIALDEKDAEAHCYLSEAKRVLDWDLVGADAELQRALELDPNSAPAHFFSALIPLFRGELSEGLRLVLEAEKLDPVSPITSYVATAAYLAIEHSGILQWIAFLPEFRPLRPDSRFANLLRRIGVPHNSILAITETNLSEIHDPNAQDHFTLKVGVKPRPGIQNGRVSIMVSFYDLTRDNKMKATDARVSYDWLTPARDWTDVTPKFLAAIYVRAKNQMPSYDGRRYGGLIVRVYFDGQLQDERATPPELLTLFPAEDRLTSPQNA